MQSKTKNVREERRSKVWSALQNTHAALLNAGMVHSLKALRAIALEEFGAEALAGLEL